MDAIAAGAARLSQAQVPSQADVVARLERLPLTSWQVRTRIVVGTATFFDAFDALAIAYIPAGHHPIVEADVAGDRWLISMGYVGQLVGAILGGWLAERIGRRPVIVISILWFGLFSIAAPSPELQSLLTLRTLQGLGLGAEVPVAATYISELARAKGRGRFVLLFEMIFPVGILAPPAPGVGSAQPWLAIHVLHRRPAGAARSG